MYKRLIYLCARVAKEQQDENEKIARLLEDAGYAVFVPHRQDKANPNHKHDPFTYDFAMMERACAAVIVGKLGRDCAAEVGWFRGRSVPMFVMEDVINVADPMVMGMLSWSPFCKLETLVDVITSSVQP